MAGGDAEGTRHVLAGPFLQHPEHHDGPLDLAELFDTGPEPDVFLGPRNELVGLGHSGGEFVGVDVVVRHGTEVTATPISRGVAHHAGE